MKNLTWRQAAAVLTLLVPFAFTAVLIAEHEPVEVSYALDGPQSVVRPGDEVQVNFTITSNLPVGAFAAAIEFDNMVLELVEVKVNDEWFGPSPLAKVHTRGGFGVGFLVVPELYGNEHFIPPGEARNVATLRFTVRPDVSVASTQISFPEELNLPNGPNAPPGEETSFFWNAAQILNGDHVDTLNRLPGTSVEIAVDRRFAAILKIVGDVTLFIRGDSNGDKKIDLSDAVTTLTYLYLGGDAPGCLDAGDANDDGRLDLSDAVYTLNSIFLGRSSIPAPHGFCGTDPTADTVTCEAYSHC